MIDRKGTKTVPLMTAILLGTLIAAMDNFIVATTMGTIVSELGGLDKFIWVTSAYLVTEMAGMPIIGKLSDMYGRKRFYVFGIIVFLIGSILCGTATSIVQLSIYRAIQGIGASSLMVIASVIIWDAFPPEKRGKMSGIIGMVFGLASIVGPLLGAFITETFNWRWVFYINVPLTLVVLFLVLMSYKESANHEKQSIDWLGAFTLVAATVSLMFALELAGNRYDWDSPQILSLFSLFGIFLIVYVLAERKAANPIISFSMFKKRLFTTGTLTSLLYGSTYVVALIYIPIFIQGVRGGTAINSGLILLPMLLSTSVTAALGGMLSSKISYRKLMGVSAILFIAGMYLLSTVSPDTSRFLITLYMITVGLGSGASFSVLGMVVLHSFPTDKRGSASSTNGYMRSLGTTIGITLFGVIQRNDFTSRLRESFDGQTPSGLSINDPHAMMTPATRSDIAPSHLEVLTDSLSGSIAHIFLWALIPSALIVVLVSMMSKERLGTNGQIDN